MKNLILSLVTITFFISNSFAQSRGIKVGYIDMEYILDKVPDYAEAKNQLDQKAQKWKQEIEEKKVEIAKLKESLKTEKVLLTKELIDEREEEIGFLETDLLDYQQKRFGPNGDLIIQKTVLVKPIQDQVFNAVQDIAEQSKYDFIFDRSSDLTMLYANKRNDISDKVVRILVRAQNREQISKKQLEKEAEAERKADQINDNPALAERQKKLEERKAARDKMLEDRKLAAEEKKRAFEERRQQLLEERENKKNGTVSDKPKTNATEDSNKTTNSKAEDDTKTQDDLDNEQKKAETEAARKKTLEERKKVIEDRKKAAQDKRQKILDDRAAAKKAKEENKTEEKP
jgi:Skp family chaperone for outer membrane proteins